LTITASFFDGPVQITFAQAAYQSTNYHRPWR